MENQDTSPAENEGVGLPDPFNVPVERLARFKARIAAQFEMAMGRELGTALDHVQPGPGCGIALVEALVALNKEHDLALSIGASIIRSEQEQGYWCNGFGWVTHPMAATGYTWQNPLAGFPDDAHYVPFHGAKAFELDAAEV